MDLNYLQTVVRKNIVKLRNRYNRRAFWVRHFFRLSGAVVIVASVSLPLVSVLDFGGDAKTKTIALSSISLLIAAITGIRSFYRWDQVWRIVRKTERDLTFKIVEWDLELNRLNGQNETPASRDAAFAATKTLVEDARLLALNELDQYFGTVAWPDVGTPPDRRRPEQKDNPAPSPPAPQPLQTPAPPEPRTNSVQAAARSGAP